MFKKKKKILLLFLANVSVNENNKLVIVNNELLSNNKHHEQTITQKYTYQQISANLYKGNASQTELSMFCALSQNYQNSFLKNRLFGSKLSEKLKNGLYVFIYFFFVDPVVLELLIKTFKILFSSITQEPPGLPLSNAIMEFLRQFASECLYYFSKKSVDNFEIVLKACSILVWGSVPP